MIAYYDNIILGSGICGLSIAYWINQITPQQSVLIIDRQQFLKGASAKNAGFLTVGSLNFYLKNEQKLGTYSAGEILDFCQTNHELLRRAGLVNDDVEYRQSGSYSITSNCKIGSFFESVDHCDFDLKADENCYFYRYDGSVNPVKLLSKLKSLLNADFAFNKDATTDWNRSSVNIENSQVGYGRCYLANNAWLNDVIETPLIQPTRAQIFRSAPIKKRFLSNYYFSNELIYLRQDQDGRLIVGGKRTLDPETESTSVEQINNQIQSALVEFARQRITTEIEVEQSWSGIMGFSPSELPLIGSFRDNVFYACGFSGHGMGMAFHLSRQLVQEVYGYKNNSECLSFFKQSPRQ